MAEIRVEHLAKSFGSSRVLDDVSFTVHDKEFVTLLGPSGCGKTTTLMSIAGFQTPDAGRIAFGDETFYDSSTRVNRPAERRNLGIVFQSYAIWPHLTVAGNVGFPGVLLLDEPFSSLDAKLRERVRAWLRDLQRSLGLSTVFVTHTVSPAAGSSPSSWASATSSPAG
jgi:iron(III) transport system ATP-binding protein